MVIEIKVYRYWKQRKFSRYIDIINILDYNVYHNCILILVSDIKSNILNDGSSSMFSFASLKFCLPNLFSHELVFNWLRLLKMSK